MAAVGFMVMIWIRSVPSDAPVPLRGGLHSGLTPLGLSQRPELVAPFTLIHVSSHRTSLFFHLLISSCLNSNCPHQRTSPVRLPPQRHQLPPITPNPRYRSTAVPPNTNFCHLLNISRSRPVTPALCTLHLRCAARSTKGRQKPTCRARDTLRASHLYASHQHFGVPDSALQMDRTPEAVHCTRECHNALPATPSAQRDSRVLGGGGRGRGHVVRRCSWRRFRRPQCVGALEGRRPLGASERIYAQATHVHGWHASKRGHVQEIQRVVWRAVPYCHPPMSSTLPFLHNHASAGARTFPQKGKVAEHVPLLGLPLLVPPAGLRGPKEKITAQRAQWA